MKDCEICYLPRNTFVDCQQCVNVICDKCYTLLPTKQCPFCRKHYDEIIEETGVRFIIQYILKRRREAHESHILEYRLICILLELCCFILFELIILLCITSILTVSITFFSSKDNTPTLQHLNWWRN